jgi:hypothetical protein
MKRADQQFIVTLNGTRKVARKSLRPWFYSFGLSGEMGFGFQRVLSSTMLHCEYWCG